MASPSWGQQNPPPADGATVRIAGQVTHPLLLHETDLLTMKRTTVNTTDERGEAAKYEGVPIVELLQRAGAPLGKELRGPNMKLYVVAKAADGYQVVFALPEFDPGFTDRVILLADRRDGHALSPREGPFRVVVPGEKRHARWIREVSTLEVLQAP
ncbi:MAG TPA: molybdopterin-dependent oxidoreductase [Candidatus Binataceae bacterium]|nr:molybdopterin-dependent oxidoreductase [Candidatus Binataceae bacterium]